MSDQWTVLIDPDEGSVGPLRLGMPRSSVHGVLGPPTDTIVRESGSVEDHYFQPDGGHLQVCYSLVDGRCDVIGVAGVDAVVWGIRPLGRPWVEVRAELEHQGRSVVRIDGAASEVVGTPLGFYCDMYDIDGEDVEFVEQVSLVAPRAW